MAAVLRLSLLGAAALMLGSCATMSEDQCLAGDWGTKGYEDGVGGRAVERLDDHAKACAKYGVTPNPDAYYSARDQGLRTYCQWQNGFRVGRSGSTYGGVCTPAEERDFLAAYEDGVRVYQAERILSEAENNVSSALSRIRDREDKLNAKERELRQDGLTKEQRDRIRDRIAEVRGEVRDARRELRQAQDELRAVEYEARAVIRTVGGRYGVF